MKQWFFIIGTFVFLYWYMPEAMKDDRVTLIEMATIGINVICFLLNLSKVLSSADIIAEGYEDADGFHRGKQVKK